MPFKVMWIALVSVFHSLSCVSSQFAPGSKLYSNRYSPSMEETTID